jgi:integrase
MLCKRCAKSIPDGSRFCAYCGKKQFREENIPTKKKKQRNGFGSIRELPSGRFQPRIMQNGISTSIGSYDTEGAANRALLSFVAADKQVKDKYNYTLGQVYQAYRQSVRYDKLADKSKEGIDTAWVHLKSLSNRKMRELDKSDYEELITSAVKQTRYKTHTPEEVAKMKPSMRERYKALSQQKSEPLSRESKLKVKNLVKLLCAEAMGSNIIATNYGDLISVDGESSAAHGVLSEEMRERLFAHDDCDEVKLVLIFLYMGWRASALLNMEKKDVHLEVEESERGNYPYGYCVGGVKTEEGRNREVPIHERILPYIQYFMGKPGKWLVTVNGKHISYDYYLRTVFPKALETSNVPAVDEYGDKITPHSTRDTFALMLYQSDVKPEIIAKLLGHTDFDVTNKKYIRNRQSRAFTAGEFSKLIE